MEAERQAQPRGAAARQGESPQAEKRPGRAPGGAANGRNLALEREAALRLLRGESAKPLSPEFGMQPSRLPRAAPRAGLRAPNAANGWADQGFRENVKERTHNM